MSEDPRKRIVAAFERELELLPASPTLRGDAIRSTFRHRSRPTSAWRLLPAIVATVLAVATVATLVLVRSQLQHASPAQRALPSSSPTPMSLSVTTPIRGYQFIGSEGTAWALTSDQLSMTTDYGSHWRSITPPGVAASLIAQANFINESSGWVAVKTGSRSVLVERTTDGGATWIGRSVDLGTDVAQVQITFVDKNNGFLAATVVTSNAASEALLFRSNDGGSTWVEASAPFAGTFSFVNPQVGYVMGGVNQNRFAKTADGGHTWSTLLLPMAPSYNSSSRIAIRSFRFFGPNLGVAAVAYSNDMSTSLTFYRTTDGGAIWQATNPLTGVQVSAPSVIDMNHFVAGADARLYRSDDGGMTWKLLATNVPVASILDASFVAPASGWAHLTIRSCAGAKQCVVGDYLVSTNDGGHTWTQLFPA